MSLSKPAYPVRTWATNANYPAGPDDWNSQPTKVDHPSPAGGFVPNQGAAAEYFNKLLFDAFTQDASAKSAMGDLVIELETLCALNFVAKVAQPATATAAAWDDGGKRWLVVGPAANARFSEDFGLTWSVSSLIAGVAAGENCCHADFDPAGNGIISTDSNIIFEYTRATNTWTKNNLIPAPGTNTRNQTVYDPVSTRWVWIGPGALTSDRLRVWYSFDRAAWSGPVLLPVGFDAVACASRQTAIDKTSGRIVFIGMSGTSAKVATSDDGGSTWTDRGTLALGFSPSAYFGHLSHDPSTGRWLYVVSGTLQTEVWASDDGTSWTKIKSGSTFDLHRPAPIGNGVWVASARRDSGALERVETVFSTDGGATWLLAGTKTSAGGAAAIGCFSGAGKAGGALLLTTNFNYVGLRVGKPDWSALV